MFEDWAKQLAEFNLAMFLGSLAAVGFSFVAVRNFFTPSTKLDTDGMQYQLKGKELITRTPLPDSKIAAFNAEKKALIEKREAIVGAAHLTFQQGMKALFAKYNQVFPADETDTQEQLPFDTAKPAESAAEPGTMEKLLAEAKDKTE